MIHESLKGSLLRLLVAVFVSGLAAGEVFAQQQTSNHGPFNNTSPASDSTSSKDRNTLTVTITDGQGNAAPGDPYVSGVVVRDKQGNKLANQPTEGSGPGGEPGENQYVLTVDGNTVSIKFGTPIEGGGNGGSVEVEVTRDGGTSTPTVTPTGGHNDNGYSDT